MEVLSASRETAGSFRQQLTISLEDSKHAHGDNGEKQNWKRRRITLPDVIAETIGPDAAYHAIYKDTNSEFLHGHKTHNDSRTADKLPDIEADAAFEQTFYQDPCDGNQDSDLSYNGISDLFTDDSCDSVSIGTSVTRPDTMTNESSCDSMLTSDYRGITEMPFFNLDTHMLAVTRNSSDDVKLKNNTDCSSDTGPPYDADIPATDKMNYSFLEMLCQGEEPEDSFTSIKDDTKHSHHRTIQSGPIQGSIKFTMETTHQSDTNQPNTTKLLRWPDEIKPLNDLIQHNSHLPACSYQASVNPDSSTDTIIAADVIDDITENTDAIVNRKSTSEIHNALQHLSDTCDKTVEADIATKDPGAESSKTVEIQSATKDNFKIQNGITKNQSMELGKTNLDEQNNTITEQNSTGNARSPLKSKEVIQDKSTNPPGTFKKPTTIRHRSLSEASPRPGVQRLSNTGFNTIFSALDSSTDVSIPKHPISCDLREILLSECRNNNFPEMLLDTLNENPSVDIHRQEENLLKRFKSLKTKKIHEILELSRFYERQSTAIQKEKFQKAFSEQTLPSYRKHIYRFYDNQLSLLIARVEKSLDLLSPLSKDRSLFPNTIKPQPYPEHILRVLEDWFSHNVHNPYASQSAVEALAEMTKLSQDQVKKWLANKRCRLRIQKKHTNTGSKRKRQHSSGW